MGEEASDRVPLEKEQRARAGAHHRHPDRLRCAAVYAPRAPCARSIWSAVCHRRRQLLRGCYQAKYSVCGRKSGRLPCHAEARARDRPAGAGTDGLRLCGIGTPRGYRGGRVYAGVSAGRGQAVLHQDTQGDRKAARPVLGHSRRRSALAVGRAPQKSCPFR